MSKNILQDNSPPTADYITRECWRVVDKQYAGIIETLGRAATRVASPEVAELLLELARCLRRSAAGVPVKCCKKNTTDETLYQLSYVSRAVERNPGRLAEIATAIARISLESNRQAGITGALSVGGGWYAQVIEGAIGRLLALFDLILIDTRHEDIRVLDCVAVSFRQFSDWSMAYSGELAPELVRRAVADYAAQDPHSRAGALVSGLVLAEAMASAIAGLTVGEE